MKVFVIFLGCVLGALSFFWNSRKIDSVEIETSSTIQTDYAELCEAARMHYFEKNGLLPPLAQVDSVEGTVVCIQLYEMSDGHTATWDWYTIDMETGLGTDFLGESIFVVLP